MPLILVVIRTDVRDGRGRHASIEQLVLVEARCAERTLAASKVKVLAGDRRKASFVQGDQLLLLVWVRDPYGRGDDKVRQLTTKRARLNCLLADGRIGGKEERALKRHLGVLTCPPLADARQTERVVAFYQKSSICKHTTKDAKAGIGLRQDLVKTDSALDVFASFGCFPRRLMHACVQVV